MSGERWTGEVSVFGCTIPLMWWKGLCAPVILWAVFLSGVKAKWWQERWPVKEWFKDFGRHYNKVLEYLAPIRENRAPSWSQTWEGSLLVSVWLQAQPEKSTQSHLPVGPPHVEKGIRVGCSANWFVGNGKDLGVLSPASWSLNVWKIIIM